MTQPAAEQPRRIPLDELTSDALDQLYGRIDELEQQQATCERLMEKADQEWNELADASRAFKAQAEQTQAWGEQHQARANRYRERYVAQRERADRAKAEQHVLQREIDMLADTVRRNVARAEQAEAALDQWAREADALVLAHRQRAERAEAAIERVRDLHVRNAHTGDCEHCSARDYPNYAVPHPCPTIAALDEQQEQP